MGINLIRKNNQETVTAYHDSVIFHLQKGVNGVIPGVGKQFLTAYDTNRRVLTIQSGMAVVYGRQFEIPDTEKIELDFSTISGSKKITVWAEVDLRDPTDEKVIFQNRYVNSTDEYYTPNPGDNLIVNSTGIARMVMYKITFNNNVVTVNTAFTILRNDWIGNADFATNSTNTVNAQDSVKVGGNKLTNLSEVLRVQMSGSTAVDILERKRKLYSGSQVLYNTSSKGTKITLSESVYNGDILEFVYEQGYYSGGYHLDSAVIRVQVSVRRVTLISFSGGTTKQSGFTATADSFSFSGATMTYSGGYYLLNFANNGGTLLENNTIRLLRVYKIIGGNAT